MTDKKRGGGAADSAESLNDEQVVRREKLARWREGGDAFPNDFRRDALAGELQGRYGEGGDGELVEGVRVKVAGRLMSRRVMGKASFADLQDVSGRIQLFLQRDLLPEGVYAEVKRFDVGDIVGAEGELFHTKTGELSVRVEGIRLLTKSLRALPEKFHGLSDAEIRYRQRYLDLIMNARTREVFEIRARAIQYIREFMRGRGFLEVETPMMHPIPGGALARPFVTQHNALDMELFLRIAPELYLKRLVVGGLERVFEINRNFRNEGVSSKHNPEFTMLEFYWAYEDYRALMDLSEEMLRGLCEAVLGSARVVYQGEEIDFGKRFARVTLLEAILREYPEVSAGDLGDLGRCRGVAERLGVEVKEEFGVGKLQMEIFEKGVEGKLVEPTFVTEYPVEVSPLSRRNDANREISDRFELFVAGREIANGFSELNDAEDQAGRFRAQLEDPNAEISRALEEKSGVEGEPGEITDAVNAELRKVGYFDADYIRALEYGLPPTAGEGIGIDRLVMLLTDSASIRDVLLFPLMRRELDLI